MYKMRLMRRIWGIEREDLNVHAMRTTQFAAQKYFGSSQIVFGKQAHLNSSAEKREQQVKKNAKKG
jgi:hypothetical protein